MQEEVVEIELDDGLVAAAQLDGAEAAPRQGAARGEESVEQRGQRGDGVGAGLAGLADDKDLDGTELAEVDVEVEVSVHAAELGAEEIGELRVVEAGDVDGAEVGQRDGTGAVDDDALLLVDLAPELQADLVAGADDVVGRDGDVVDGREGGGDRAEEAHAEDGQRLAGAFADEPLELGGWVGWAGRGYRLGAGIAAGLVCVPLWVAGVDGRGESNLGRGGDRGGGDGCGVGGSGIWGGSLSLPEPCGEAAEQAAQKHGDEFPGMFQRPEPSWLCRCHPQIALILIQQYNKQQSTNNKRNEYKQNGPDHSNSMNHQQRRRETKAVEPGRSR